MFWSSMSPVTRKMRRNWPTSVAFLLSIVVAGPLMAAEREHEAHEHGHGRLNVAIEGNSMEVELVSPGADIVGFEHAPETQEDRAAVAKAVAMLKKGDALFVPPEGAACRLEDAEVTSALIDEHYDDHDDHGHEEKHAGHEDEEHAEFHAHYHFHCEHPDRLTHMDVKVFEIFPGARELDVQAISPKGQTAAELTPGAPRLTF